MLVLKLVILSVVLVAIAVVGLGVRVFFKKNGSFPEHMVGHNKEMRKRKIFCVKTQDKIDQKAYIKMRRLEIQRQKEESESLHIYKNMNEADLGNISLLSE